MEEHPEIERGKRPRTATQHRQLPSSIHLSSKKAPRKECQTKTIPLLKMKYTEDISTSPPPPNNVELRRRRQGRTNSCKEKTREFVLQSTVHSQTDKRRSLILLVCTFWLLLIFYRIYTSLYDKNFNKLSITYLISKLT